MVSSMVLSRYFDKSDYGTYRQVMYVYHTLLTVFTFGLPRAYSFFLPRVSLGKTRSLINKISKIFVVLGLLFSITLFVFSGLIADILNNEDLKLALRVFSVVPTLLLPTMGLEGILATYQKTHYVAMYTIATRVLMLISVIVPVVFLNGGYIEAIIGFVCSSFLSLLLASYLKYLPVKNEGNENCQISLKQIFQFSIPLLAASMWGMVIDSADQFFVSRYFGNEVFAEFSNGNMNMPFIGMIVGATTTVLSPIFSRLSHERLNPQTEIFPVWKSVFEKTAMLIYPLVLYCFVFADFIMVLLYGEQYKVSGGYFQIRLITNLFTIIAFAPLLINIGKVKFYSSVHMYGAISLVLLEFLGVKIINSPYTISIISALCSIGRIAIMLYAIAKWFSVSYWSLFPILLISKLIVIPTLFLYGIRYLIVELFEYNTMYVVVLSSLSFATLFVVYSNIVRINYISILKSLKK